MLHVEVFTDPGCPFAWSAEPHARRIEWLYGDQLSITSRMVVLSERPEEYLEKGFDPAKQAAGMGLDRFADADGGFWAFEPRIFRQGVRPLELPQNLKGFDPGF